MKNSNLSKIEKNTLKIYMLYVILVLIFSKKILFGVIFYIIVIILSSKRKSNNDSVKYLLKEKIELIIRHYFLLCIFWNIIFTIIGGFDSGFIGFFDIIISLIILIIFLLPFAGILKLIHNLSKIKLNKDIVLYREPPQKISPAVIAYYMQEKVLDRSDISATLLDLVRRGYLKIENDRDSFKDITQGILGKKLIVVKNYNHLKAFEKFLIEWFLRISNSNTEIDMSGLRDGLKLSTTLKDDYDTWERLVKEETEKLDFYGENTILSKFSKCSVKVAKLLGILSLIIFVIFILYALIIDSFGIDIENISFFLVLFLLNFGLPILAIIIYDLRLPSEYLNEIGSENIRKWKGFIEFLKEFSIIDERNIEEVYIWEEYLVYAVALGVSKKTIDTMNQAYGFDSYISNC